MSSCTMPSRGSPVPSPAIHRGWRPRAGAYAEALMPDILEGRIEPGWVLDRTIGLDDVPAGYRGMNERLALKIMIEP